MPGERDPGVLPVPGAVLTPRAAAAAALTRAGRGAGGSPASQPGAWPAAASRGPDASAEEDEELGRAPRRSLASRPAASPRGGARLRPRPRSAPAAVMPPRSPPPRPD